MDDIGMLHNRIFSRNISLECMAALMGHYIHIPAVPLKLAKIKGA